MTADLDLKRDSENFYDTPASVYNIKKKFHDQHLMWLIYFIFMRQLNMRSEKKFQN